MITVTVKRNKFMNMHGALEMRVQEKLREIYETHGEIATVVSEPQHNDKALWVNIELIPTLLPQQS